MTARILALSLLCVLVVCAFLAICALPSDTADLSAQINATTEAVDRASKALKEWQDKLDERAAVLDQLQAALHEEAETNRRYSAALDRRSKALDELEELLEAKR